jgi:hypothetical protein
MTRPALVVRRFGDVSFGLGFFENGAWIDHTELVGDRLVADDLAADERLAFDAFHTWFGCCRTAGEPVPMVMPPEPLPLPLQSATH